MTKLNGIAHIAMLSLALALSGCGGGDGGGVNSTPTPTPSPSPTPTPTARNDDLIAPLVSESFVNNAATSSASYNSSGAASGQSQGAQTLSISYNAAANSYTVSTAGRSQTFSNADRVSLPANFRKTNGAITDDLTLTPAGEPGSAPLAYKYVGGGFWQRQTQSGGGINGSFDAFAYGVPTEGLVRSGAGYYKIDVLGALNAAGEFGPDSFRGSGVMSVDFTGGKLSGSADVFVYRSNGVRIGNGNRDGVFGIDAQLAGSGSGFSGTAQLLAFGDYNGVLNGQFFGPGAAEVGAAFSGQTSTGYVMAGAMLGRKDASLATATLAGLTDRTIFSGVTAGGSGPRTVMTYDPANASYTIPGDLIADVGQLAVGPAQKASSQPDTKFVEYNLAQDGRDIRILNYRTGADNSEIQLTYTTFTRVFTRPTDTASTISPTYLDLVWGMRTAGGSVPTLGSATYAGVIYGDAKDNSRAYSVGGTSLLNVNFGEYRVGGTLHPILTNRANGAVLDYGVQTLNVVLIDSQGIFSGVVGGDGQQSIRGFFFGPRAEEIGAGFSLRRFDGTTDGVLNVAGITVGKRQ